MNSGAESHSNLSSSTPIKAITAILLAMICLALAGCGNEMTTMKQNQASLQILIEENARQMAGVVATMDSNQKQLQATIESLRETTQKLSDDMTYVSNAHAELSKIVDEKDKTIAARVDGVEQTQQTMRSDLDQTADQRELLAADIASVSEQHLALRDTVKKDNATLLAKVSTVSNEQTNLRSELAGITAGFQEVVADISSVVKARGQFEATVNKKMADQMAAVRRDQQKQQDQIDTSAGRIEQVTTGLATLENSLSKLEQLMREDAKNFSEAFDLFGQKQMQLEEQAKRDVRGLAGSLDAVKQRQDALGKQIDELQGSFDGVIKSLKSDLEKLNASLKRLQPLEIAKDDKPRPKAIQAEPNKGTVDSP